jgi:hypothetical protein
VWTIDAISDDVSQENNNADFLHLTALPRSQAISTTALLLTPARPSLHRVPQSLCAQSLIHNWQVPLHKSKYNRLNDISYRQFQQFLEQ